MKPFDLEKAKAGAPVCTRDGRPVRIVCFDAKNDYPILALITEKDNLESPCLYREDGRYSIMEDKRDLFCAPIKHKGWINIFKNGYAIPILGDSVWENESAAKREAEVSIHYHLATIQIEWEE